MKHHLVFPVLSFLLIFQMALQPISTIAPTMVNTQKVDKRIPIAGEREIALDENPKQQQTAIAPPPPTPLPSSNENPSVNPTSTISQAAIAAPIFEPTATPIDKGSTNQASEPQASVATFVEGRGFDPSNFQASFFDNDNLQTFLFTRVYNQPLDFILPCFGENPPYNGCKLIPELTEGGTWSVRWEGNLTVPQSGEYTFYLLEHDDGVLVIIDGAEVIDNGWYYPSADHRPSPQTVTLTAGSHNVVVDFEQRMPWMASLRLLWSGPGFTDEVIPFIAGTIVDDDATDNDCGNIVEECLESAQAASNGYEGGPINTRTGGVFYQSEDLSIPTSAGVLTFNRSYSSLATDFYNILLGYGWTHSFDTRLILPNDPNGQEGFILFKAHTANRYRFKDNGDGTYSPAPGVTGTLAYSTGLYTLTMSDQSIYIFDMEGKMQTWEDAQGHLREYLYNVNGQLEKVSADSGQRYLALTYESGQIATVSDHTGRTVYYDYDVNGDLTSVTDLAGEVWEYTYDSSHHLTAAIDPLDNIIERTEYDELGRAVRQYNGNDELVLELVYNADGTTTVRDGLGNDQTHAYDSRNTLTILKDAAQATTVKTYDYNFRPSSITDPLDNVVNLTWSPDGNNLTQIEDAAGNITQMDYDSLNNLTTLTDPRNKTTTYDYNGTLLESSTDALDNTTYFTYTTPADAPQPPGLLKTVEDPQGRLIGYTYNNFGQIISITNDLDQTTTYDYDDLGRQKTIHYPQGRSDWFCYDSMDRVIREVVNASGDGQSPQTDPCDEQNYQPAPGGEYDQISKTIYDAVGNTIATVTPDGVITRTYYNENNRPVTVVSNLYGQSVETPTAPVYDPEFSDRNIRTDTVFDQNGNAIAAIDTLGTITRTYFDIENRPEYMVQNLAGQEISFPTPPVYNPVYPDRNLVTQTVYDPDGNVIAIIDPMGVITRTYYDQNNRPVSMVINLSGQTIENPVPPVFSADDPDANVRTDSVYDENGNVIATIDPLGRITRTYFDALNRPVTVAQNLVGQEVSFPTPPAYNPLYPDRNLLTNYVYDPSGNTIAVVDPNGVITRTFFDDLNRPTIVVKNLYGQEISEPVPPIYNPAFPDRNVRTEAVYNSEGQQIASIDANGKTTRTYFDSLGRVWATIRNLTGQLITDPTPPVYNPGFPDQNIRSETVYDGSGQTIATIANEGAISRTYFDKLGRSVAKVENLTGYTIQDPNPPAFDPNHPDQNIRTDIFYDGIGRAIKTITSDGEVSYTCYDPLGRAIKQIVNPTVTDPCQVYTPSFSTDQDIITETTYDASGDQVKVRNPIGKDYLYQYDALHRLTSETDPLLHQTLYGYDGSGNRISTTNADGIVTQFEYDGANRLTAVIEPNYETNIRTEYTYDANGNQMAINDGLNHTTNFTYDALGRIKTEQDAMMNVSTYMYDAGGNRTGLLDANGYTTNFQYDSLNRIQTIDYPAPDSDVTYTYNAAGLRQTMIDGSGTTSWEYDGLYRPIAVNNPFDHTVQYTYNSAGNRTSLTYPDMRSVSYDYDQAGRIASVIDWNSGITNYGYDKAGQPATIDLPNGINTSYTFDDAGRLLQKTNQSASELLSSFEYTYDNRGNRTQVVETTKLAVAPSSDLLFSDGFESGDLSAWLERPIDQGDLVVNPAAAMTGTFGMQAIIDDNNPLPVMNCSPVSETRYKAGFQFDPNSISMASGDALYLFEGTDSSNWIKLQLEFRYYRSEYQIRVSTIDDSSHWINTSWYAISDQPHSLEFEWKAATAPGARNGTLQLWIDGTSKQTVTRLDNDTARLDQVKLGAVSEIDNGTRGSLYFDNFTSYRSQPWGSDPVVKTINYKYDQLDRLYEANYSDGILFVYYYDDVGNRTMERIQNNVTTYAYDSANRPTTVGYVNYSWDNNGNLLSDGVNTFTYDHANHLTTVTNQQSGVTLSFTYNGLGDRVSSTVNGVTTNYTLDLAAGLTQVLQDNTDTYIYGNERISQESTSGMEYFLSDAQGSVRQLVVGTGTVNLTKTYRPYGSQLDRIGNAQSSYDFTGEWRDRSPNLIYLRSRYYSPYIGRFLTKDIWPGNDKEPMSNNRWIYGYDNPVNLIDPSGRFPVWCQSMPTAGLYEACVLAYYQLEPLEYYLIGSSITGQKGCYQGKIAYRAPGYLEGIGGFVTAIWGGTERVYDFATMESESFNYRGQGISDAVLGIGVSFYNGWVLGFRSDQSPRGVEIDYQGPFTVGQVGIGLDVGIGIGAGLYGFRSTSDPFVRGTTWYVGVSLSLDFLEGIDIGAANLNYTPINNSYHSYALSSGKVNKSELLSDIMNGSGSPLPPFVLSNRPLYALLALNYTRAYEEIRNAK